MNQLGGIVLAAGGSSRLGQPKQMLDVEGQVLVRRQTELLLGQDFGCVVVVTGAAAAMVQQALQGLCVQTVHNPNWQEGMGGSLACGIAAMPERVRGALLLLCDQWRVTAEDLRGLVSAWQLAPIQAVSAQWQDESENWVTGAPAIFPRALFARLGKLQGDRGAQSALKHYAGGTRHFPMPNAAFDIDVPADLCGLH